MAFLRKWEKGGSVTFALVEGRRVKRGKDKGKPRQRIIEYIGNLQDLSRWVVDKRDAVNLETVSIKSVVRYGDVYATLTIANLLELYDALFPYVQNHEYLKMLLAILINKNIEPKVCHDSHGCLRVKVPLGQEPVRSDSEGSAANG